MSDQRFSALASDPRYRLPNRKKSRTAVDHRFKGLYTDEEFNKKASVDRYGRKIKSVSKDTSVSKSAKKEAKASRGSTSKTKVVEREVVGSSEDEDEDEDEDESEAEEVIVKGGKRDYAREGFSESSSEEETSDEESDAELELADETAGNEQTEEVPTGDVSRRIAAVNLDWDNIRAVDIMAVAASLIPSTGKVDCVTIYPSEYGRERMAKEELEGPPREIFASTKKRAQLQDQEEDEGSVNLEDNSDDDEKIKKRLLGDQTGDGEEFDTAMLRQYQLERLKYYYAVMECNNEATAQALYEAMDGREYQSTSNFFDLRFVPDETSFEDDVPHDECFQVPSGYCPNDFRTEALTHSKVRLTWDDDDPTRKEMQKRAFSRAEIEENDLQAYIGTDDSDLDSISSRISTAEARKAAKKAEQKEKMRAALGLGLEPLTGSKKGKEEVVGDMQITFTSGLSNGKSKKDVFENQPQDEESVRERYIRKEKERKLARKERRKARTGEGAEDEDDDVQEPEAIVAKANDDNPFNDPFFNDPAAAAKAEKSARKADKMKKRRAEDAKDADAQKHRAELELLTVDDQADNMRHFDMREIEKAEKDARKKGKAKKNKKTQTEHVKDDFKLETEDPRFKALFESHEYAIDPTNPRFKNTENMKTLLEEGRKKRKFAAGDAEEAPKVKRGKEDDELGGLVARLKNRNKA